MLLRAYAHLGVDAFIRAEGMFVITIWDGQKLTLIRDPLGTRTMFYTRLKQGWLASSTLKTIRHWPRQAPSLNLAAVRAFLSFAYVPGKETLFENVFELLPGTCVHLTPNRSPQTDTYWEPAETPWDDDTPVESYQWTLRQCLSEAVASHLPDDEPVGIFLSGGLDSSLVTALAAKQHPRPIKTYAISFGDDLPNELPFAGMVAQHCQTEHQILSISGRKIADHLPETLALLDCPVGDPLTVPNLLLARRAAADGLSVVLNGEGGDPLFGGPKNIPMLVYEYHRHHDTALDRAQAYLRSYRKAYSYLPQLLSMDAQEALLNAPPLENLVLPYLESPRMTHYVNKLMAANTRLKGAHHILTKVERLTASAGIEGRSPLFAPTIAEYAFAIPPQLKLKGLVEKWILKQAVADLLPQSIITRPKSGMRVPVQAWLNGPLKKLATSVLLGQTARRRSLYQLGTLKAWMRGENLVYPRHGAMLWLVLSLELWLQSHLDW